MTAFEEVAEKIQATSQRLAEERELVMEDKAKFDLELPKPPGFIV